MSQVKKNNLSLIPIDSEHSAIYQCLSGESISEVSRIILTASGGPFRGWSQKQMRHITPSMAVKHPTWNMGSKISLDSATLINKGLEVIEAHYLFGIHLNKIDVFIHKASVIHSMIEFIDGSIKAQLGISDMKIPILYAFSYPRRLLIKDCRLDFLSCPPLDFEEVDHISFPGLNLAYEACRLGGTYPLALNAANEIAVESFLKQHIDFLDIVPIIEHCLERHDSKENSSIQERIEINKNIQLETKIHIKKKYRKEKV